MPDIRSRSSQDPLVRLSHFSVEEYLVTYATRPVQTNQPVRATSLAYLLQFDQERSLMTESPFAANQPRSQLELAGSTPLDVGRGKDYHTILYDMSCREHLEAVGPGTSLADMAEMGATELMRLLLDQGCNLNTQYRSLGSALRTVSRDANYTATQLLLQRGADVNA